MNKRSRKYLLTYNNPSTTLQQTIDLLTVLNPDYICGSDEVGSEGTPHQHIFIHRSSSALYFDAIKKILPTVHVDYCYGTSEEVRDYVFKQGKHEGTDKEQTNLKHSHIEIGVCPHEEPGKRTDFTKAISLIKDGYSNLEIIDEVPSMFDKMGWLDRYRQEYLMETIGKQYRSDLEVIYISGNTGVGKTSGIYKKHGYDNVYKAIIDHRNPYDHYQSQPVLLLDEFNSSIKIQDMLQLLDKYPYQFDTRYTNKWLCATTIYIVSNKPLWDQYPKVQKENPEIWNAFLRRITRAYIQIDTDTQLPVEIVY